MADKYTLTCHIVARRLSLNVRSVRKLIRQGALNAISFSKEGARRPTYRISEEDYKKFIEQRNFKVDKSV